MKFITVPGTELRPSTICLGSTHIGSVIDVHTSFQLLDLYVEQGGNFLDTAEVYANWLPGERSISEKTIGKWLQQSGKRDDIILATKGAHPRLATMHIGRMSRPEIVHDLVQSLNNLQTDRIDLYWLHRDDEQRPVEEILDTLADQVRAGKIRYYGCSNWRTARMQAAQAHAIRQGMQGFVANQMMWSLASVDPASVADPTMVVMDDEMRKVHRETGMAAIPYSSQANGLFQRMAEGTLAQMNANLRNMYRGQTNERRFQRIRRLAAVSGLSITGIVLGYLQSQPFPTIPIIGCRTIEQLRDSLSAADVRLSPEQIKELDQA